LRRRARRSAQARSATPRPSDCFARAYCEFAKFRVPSSPNALVTTGSSAGFVLAFLSMFDAGDRVAVANPGYPPYRHILSALGCEPVLIETGAVTRFAITGESLRAAHARKPLSGVLVASRPIRPAP
jgi:aspartate/methionine/tyrosine aminotransferase